jgi:hypothetical protein
MLKEILREALVVEDCVHLSLSIQRFRVHGLRAKGEGLEVRP